MIMTVSCGLGISKFGKLFHNQEMLTCNAWLGKLFFHASLTDRLSSDGLINEIIFEFTNFLANLNRP